MCVCVYFVISGEDIEYLYATIPGSFVGLKALMLLSTTFEHTDLSKAKTKTKTMRTHVTPTISTDHEQE